jgi:hypothetical protein
MRRWRRLLIFGIPVLLALIAATVILLPRLTTNPRGPEVPVTRAIQLTPHDITRLEHALDSSDMAVQATALIPDLAHIYLQQGEPMFPASSTVKFLLNTETCKDLSCKVNAVVTEKGGKTTTFVLYLDDGTGQWLIAGTDEMR